MIHGLDQHRVDKRTSLAHALINELDRHRASYTGTCVVKWTRLAQALINKLDRHSAY